MFNVQNENDHKKKRFKRNHKSKADNYHCVVSNAVFS